MPFHQISGPHTAWTRVNAAEAVVGVQTPLSLTYWDLEGETGFRLAYVQMGLLARSGLRIPESIDEHYTGFFYGRCATNLDAFRAALAAMPGSVEAAEEGIFASRGEAARRRSPWTDRVRAATKLTVAGVLLPRRLRRARQASDAFWRTATRPGALDGPGDARAALVESQRRFADAICLQVVSSTIAGLLYGRVQDLLAAIGRPDLELPLIGGYGAMSEIQLTKDLAALGLDGDDLAGFLARHGYHGPAEGELSSRSWREDPAPVVRMLGALRAMPGGADPAAAERRQRTEREAAERTVLASRTGAGRLRARCELSLARRYLPSRVEAKAAFMQIFDAARAAARVLGGQLVARGVLDDADDVFYLTLDEVLGELPPDARAVVAERRVRRAEYEELELPLDWVGMPQPRPSADPTAPTDAAGEGAAAGDRPSILTAVGVSAGTVEGVARVLVEPSDPDALQPGEVLVCHTTDPSWSCYFFVAGAVVIDIGGPLSHGAIVARELGIPCVVNTERGTRTIRSGDRVRVDGRAGTVEILSRT